MVVHTPTKLDSLRQAAAERRAANYPTPDVPPSVLAAGTGAQDPVAPLLDAAVDPADGGGERHDFDAWNGDLPPGSSIEVQADLHAAGDEEEEHGTHDNITVRKGKTVPLTNKSPLPDGAALPDPDKISVVSDVTPPPQTTGSFDHPQINPFTPEWFAKVIGAAASAAASAVASSPRPTSSSSSSSAAPQCLNER